MPCFQQALPVSSFQTAHGIKRGNEMTKLPKCWHCGKRVIKVERGWDCPDWEKHEATDRNSEAEEINRFAEFTRQDILRFHARMAAEDY